MNNVETMPDLYAAFGRRDIGTVLEGMDPNVEWREAENNPYQPSGEPWIGPDAILNNLFVRLGTEWDGFSVNPKEFHDAGDTVEVEVRYTGTHQSTGNNLDAQATHVWRLRNGKVTGLQQYVDTARLREVTGAG